MLNAICGFVRFFTGVQVRWLGTQPQQVQRIYFANHTSHFDCLVLLSVLPRNIRKLVRPAGAADYWTATPIRNWFSQKIMHVIPIERLRLTKTNNPIKPLIQALEQGSSLIIFPEGGRSATAEIRKFKSGIYHLSKKRPDVELVPTYIENANRILPKGECIPIPMLCSITFGEPIHLRPNECREDFLERAEQAIKRCAS
jgi:1-acyl-sn-glycerol-3-phosphate acyltransferase